MQTGAASGVIGGIIYAAGGADCCVPVSTVTAYAPGTDTWMTKTSMPTARHSLAGGVINDILYAVGGYSLDYSTYTNIPLATIGAYDPSTNTWTTKAPMPTPRAELGVGVVNGILYAVGGNVGPPGSWVPDPTVEAYDPSTNTWTTKAPMPTGRTGLTVQVVDGILYAIGGRSTACYTLATVEAYHPVTNTWTTVTAMPTARADPAAAVVNGVIYVAGGFSVYECNTGWVATLEAYTPSAPPVANAGPDQTVNEGTEVTLDGTGSTGQNLTFNWAQLAVPTVTLSGANTANPSFIALLLPGGFGSQVLTFQLTVTSGSQSSSDTVDITVKNVNHAPVADGGSDQIVNEGSQVMLNGSASYDPDGDPITYQWVQIIGTAVTLSDANTANPTFTAPMVSGGGSELLEFELTVSDTDLSSTDNVQVTVEQVNHPPIANAGPDQTTNEGSLVTLDGTASGDPDSDPLTYNWFQTAGPPVILSNSQSSSPSFTAPAVGPGGATLEFQLIVNDPLIASEPDEVVVTVLNVNDPPACQLAKASIELLWPPNHKLIPVGIVGVADPNKDQVTINITGVTQDEPINSLEDGDTSPDAVIQGDKVLIRAERSGIGNGRVYRIYFTANDGKVDGVCNGSVTVGVPLNMKKGVFPVDDGQFYDSTVP